MERGGETEIVREIVHLNLREAACLEQSLMSSRVPDRHVAFDLPQDAARFEALHEVFVVGCVKVERRARLQRALDPAKDRQELVVVDVFGEIQGKPGVEAVRMAGGSPRFVSLIEEENFALDLDALERAITRRTVAILFANPNKSTPTYSRIRGERSSSSTPLPQPKSATV